MRAYINAQKPKTISAVIHHSMLAAKIFPTLQKVVAKPNVKNEKEKVPDRPFNGKKVINGQKPNGANKKKVKGQYQGSNKLTPEELDQYRKAHKCFRCGEQGHTYRECPKKGYNNKEAPEASQVVANEVEDSEASQLCYAWGRIRDQDAFMLFDPGSTHNFISIELAQRLGISTDELGPALEACGAFKGQEVPVTPLIGKLRLHVQGYTDNEEFFISPLGNKDVILGAPWFHRVYAKLEFPSRVITISTRDREIKIRTEAKAQTIPIVSSNSIQKLMKSSLFAYMIVVQSSQSFNSSLSQEMQSNNVNGFNSSLHDDTHTRFKDTHVEEVTSYLKQYQDCFSDELPNELPPVRGEDDHMIDLIPGTAPPNRPPYRVSRAQQEEIMSQVHELLEKGLIRPSSSPFCSPVLLVQKKDGTYRMCVDYRALNKSTIKNRFPVPRIEDIFDKLQGSSYYSRLDLKSGYHQIRIVPQDIHKTAFRTSFGLYEFLVMPFGLTNAPATFNRLMDRIFRKHRQYTGVFFDDIIVYSKTLEEHKEHLKVVFEELRAHKLYVNAKKSEFFLQEIRYLGHIISKEGIQMDPEKLKVIDEWPIPKNIHEVRSFIGMCSYYRRFISKFAIIAGPLHDLTKKKVKFQWTLKEHNAFVTLKQRLMSKPLLKLPNLDQTFEIHCDACGDSLGAVLSQEGQPIAYESRRLQPQECTLGIYEKELLTVIHALDSWKHYLLGTPFIIRTDHQSIRYFMTQTKLSEKQMRWANFLSQFHFHIAHIPGKLNPVADALSRRPMVNAVSIAYNHDLTSMINMYAQDEDYASIVKDLEEGKASDLFSLKEGFLMHGQKLCITKALREKVMDESHAPPYVGHRGIQTTLQAIEIYFYWPTIKQDVQRFVEECMTCQKVKFDRGKAPGLLQPLPIPTAPWESISMDFIFGLPKSIHGNTGIWTIVD